MRGLFHIFFKDVAHFSGNVRIVDEGVCLKVQGEAADIQIGRSNGTDFIIHGDGFRMKETIVIDVDIGTAVQEHSAVTIGSPVDEHVVRHAGNHDPYIDTGKGSHFQCFKNGIVRDEVGRLDTDALFCRGDHL